MKAMKVYEVMTQDVNSVAPHVPVCEAAKIMEAAQIGFLPIVSGSHVIGVITDRDLALRVVAKGLSSMHTDVAAVMTAHPVFVYEDQPLEEAVDLMCARGISRLLVQNRQGATVGLLSSADIATLADPGQSEALAEALGESYWQSHMFADAASNAS